MSNRLTRATGWAYVVVGRVLRMQTDPAPADSLEQVEMEKPVVHIFEGPYDNFDQVEARYLEEVDPEGKKVVVIDFICQSDDVITGQSSGAICIGRNAPQC